MIMLLFNTYSTISYCAESIIEEKIKEASLNNYFYYSVAVLASITLVYTTFLLSAYCFPEADVLNLFHNKDLILPNYSLNSLIYEEILDNQVITHYFLEKGNDVFVNRPLFERLINNLHTQEKALNLLNIELLIKQQQLENYNKLLDFMSPTFSEINQPLRRNSI